jgi:hypothetical protein
MKLALRLALAAMLLSPAAAMAQSVSAFDHANGNASFKRAGGAPLPIVGTGLPAFAIAGLGYWLYNRRKSSRKRNRLG